MPAKDKYHDTVIRALEKAGWIVEQEQVRLVIKGRYIYLDLQASYENRSRIILIEVKSFENIPSPVSALEDIAGQYMVYRAAIQFLKIEYPLYLAIPQKVFDTFFQEELSQQTISLTKMQFLVFDPEREEIVTWQD